MISVKQSISELEQLEMLFRASLACYVAAIGSVRNHMLDTCREPEDHRLRLRSLEEEAQKNPSRPVLEHSAAAFDQAMAVLGAELRTVREDQESNVRGILATLAEAAHLLNQRSDVYSKHVREFSQELETAAKLDDLGEVRRRITLEVAVLRSSVEAMCADNQTAIERLNQEMDVYRERLATVERMAYVDPLTGLGNRRGAEREIDRFIERKAEFCLIVIDINRFRWINDRYGRHVGDQVLKQFAKRLEREVRQDDAVFRWGGDEFLALVQTSLSDAMRRTFQLGPRLRGRYLVTSEGKEIPVDIGASLGVAEYLHGETQEQVLSRADAAIHQQRTVEATR